MSRTRTCTVVEASSSAAKGLKEDLASNLASAALAMSTSVTALATAAALMTAQQRALADAYAAPRGPLESLYGALADEVLQWCGLKTLGRAACASRSLREHCYAPHLFGAAKVGLALQRDFPTPRSLGEARFLCAPEPRAGRHRGGTFRAPSVASGGQGPTAVEQVRAPLASFVLGCTGGTGVVDDDVLDDFEGFAAKHCWIESKKVYRKHVVRSQQCLRALRDTRRLLPGTEICYVSSVHDGAFVSRVSAGSPHREKPPSKAPPSKTRALPPERALVHLSCGHSSWRASPPERGASPSVQASSNIRAAVDLEASALKSRDLDVLVCEHLVCDAQLPTLKELSVVALHAVRNGATPVDALAQVQLVNLLGCSESLEKLQLRAPRAVAFPPDAAPRVSYLAAVDIHRVADVAKRYFPKLRRFSVVALDARGETTTGVAFHDADEPARRAAA